MNDSLKLEDLERQAYRYDAQDGIMEFLAGALFFFIARAIGDPHLAWVPVVLIFPMRWALKFFKERFTYPRIGYVKLRSEKPGSFGWGVLAYLGIMLGITMAALMVFGDITSWDQWMKWMPALMGGFTSGGFFFAAGKGGLPRHYLLGVFCIGWGVTVALLPSPGLYDSLQRWALGMGLVNLAVGVTVFLVFLRTHPVRPAEVADEQA